MIAIGVLVWLMVCLFVLALCVAARRGDEILRGSPRPGMLHELPSWPSRSRPTGTARRLPGRLIR